MREIECFSYVVKDDCGYAPNPWGECTLAVCKPAIRRTAKKGDWIVGITPKEVGFKAVYLMIVDELVPLFEYFREERFTYKKPDFKSDDIRKWMGDNFYEFKGGKIIQHISAHNYKDRIESELIEKMRVDLSGQNVLIANEYFYYGSNAPNFPKELEFLRVGRFHKCHGLRGILEIERYAAELIRTPGVFGDPRTLEKEAKKLRHLSSA